MPAETVLFESYADVIQLQKFASEGLNSDVQLAKLERMKQYADALSCRRKILLSYFGELVKENCGNCDICKNPPTFFDGTILAQKALSAISRLQESEPLAVIVDFLRGSKNAYIYEKNYQNLKTYGIGADISWYDWNQYLIQLINLGYCEIAFHQHNKILLTSFAKKVLFEDEKVKLNTVVKKVIDKNEIKEAKTKTTKSSLFEILRKLRYEIAKDEEVPAYVIFSDAALRQMETLRPMSDEEFLAIEGVGKVKLEKYGSEFIDAIIYYEKVKKANTKVKKEGNTYKTTLALFKEGNSVEEIAGKRNLGQTTIISHLAKLYVDGHDFELSQFVSEKEISQLQKAQIELEFPTALKPYYDHFEEKMSYDKIRFGLAFLERHKNDDEKLKIKGYSLDEKRLENSEAYKKWSSEEDSNLVHFFYQGKKVKEIALLLGRNDGAISSRLKKLELKK
ncbi:ATP-dependent DNA helicase RecQ [compost metagenome]